MWHGNTSLAVLSSALHKNRSHIEVGIKKYFCLLRLQLTQKYLTLWLLTPSPTGSTALVPCLSPLVCIPIAANNWDTRKWCHQEVLYLCTHVLSWAVRVCCPFLTPSSPQHLGSGKHQTTFTGPKPTGILSIVQITRLCLQLIHIIHITT